MDNNSTKLPPSIDIIKMANGSGSSRSSNSMDHKIEHSNHDDEHHHDDDNNGDESKYEDLSLLKNQAITDLKELKDINTELKRLSVLCKDLREKKKERETRIMKYLEKVDQPGVKYGGIVVFAQEGKKRERKKEKEKIKDAELVLQSKGIKDSKEVVDAVMKAMKGNQFVKTTLKFKDLS